MKTDVRIDNLRDGSRFGAICSADVTLLIIAPGRAPVDLVTIRDCQLRDGQKGEWLAMPSRQYTTADGEKKYARHAEMPEHTYKAALAAVQKAWATECGQDAGPEQDDNAEDPFEDM